MKIILTGSGGFLGSHVLPLLSDHDVYNPPSVAYDLTRLDHIQALFRHTGTPDAIIHLAASVGGIKYNLEYPAFVATQNTLMNTLLISEAAIRGVEKFIFAGSVCSYPLDTAIPTDESWLGKGWPEPSNLAYGVSKLSALVLLQACKQQYGMDFSYPVFANLYGPNDGGFKHKEKAHLIPNLIRKFATQDNIRMLGRGTLTRDLLYVEDAAKAIVQCLGVNYSSPINIATGVEVSIRDMVDIIHQLAFDDMGVAKVVEFVDTPDKGEQRRCYDITRAKDILSWQPEIDIEEGLKRTWEWFRDE